MHYLQYMDSHLRAIAELTAILDGGVRYSIERVDDRFRLRLGDPDDEPILVTVVDDIEQAVAWLTEQAKVHYPHSAYTKRLLTNGPRGLF